METIHCPLCLSSAERELWRRRDARYVECKNCGLVYENPRPTPQELKDYYSEKNYFFNQAGDRETSGYVNYFSQCDSAILEEYAEILRRYCPADQSIRYLDIGCGPGNLVQLGSQNGWEALGVEISRWAVEYGRQRGIQIIEGTLAEAKFPDESFHVISLFDVLEHLPFPGEYAKEIQRILKPRGVVVAETPNIRGIFAWNLYREKSDLVKPHAHICLYSPHSVRRLFYAAGFSKVIVRTFPYCRRYTFGYLKSLVCSRIRSSSALTQFTFNESLRIVAWKQHSH
jgi:2-polyprenyl-3-methyl-5-hydroxy-6-metoxy-1,4-benzoquinol methylase